MDNGAVVCARFPLPSAGPAFYTTASEAATRTFLREVLDISIPRIISWSAHRTNSVGAEYILEERAQGEPLDALWRDWDRLPMQPRHDVIKQVVQIERKLADTRLEQYGCIYFKEDVPHGEPLNFPHGEPLKVKGTISPSTLEQFRMGPLVDMDYWVKEKASMIFNRGPFNSARQMVKSKATSEKRYIEQHARPRLVPTSTRSDHETPEEMLYLIGKFFQLAPAMIPPPTSYEINDSTLWHPKLHGGNIFVDPTTLKVTSVVGWHSITAAPLSLQCQVPALVNHREPVSLDFSDWPRLPENYEDLGQDEKKYATNMQRGDSLHQAYLRFTKSENPRHWSALQSQSVYRSQPLIVQEVWRNNTVFFLRRALMRIVISWEDICPDAGPCPVTFSDEDCDLFDKEVDVREYVSGVVNLIEERYGYKYGGPVPPEKYDEVKNELERLKDACLEAADNGEERFRIENFWPYRDSVEPEAI